MAEKLASETSSASRQKSCHACMKGKRGCDKQYPVCARCEERKVPCVYAKRTHAEAFPDFDSVEMDMVWAEFTALSQSIDFVNDIPPTSSPGANLDSTSLPTLDTVMNPFLNFLEHQSTSSSDMQLINGVVEHFGQHKEKERLPSKFDYSPMADICIQYEPWQVYDPTTKVHFIVQSIKGYPSAFAKDNCTPWMHRYLYKEQMPSSIRSCFTACALYSNMTSSNKPSVLRILCQSLTELKQQHSANTPHENLARTQALFLYQIIGLFDGDITLRSSADRSMPLLQDWLDELCKIRENLTTQESVDDSNRPRSWKWWIFSESVRRTIVIAYAFLGMWSIMCKNSDPVFFGAWQYVHRWTMSRPLWEAPSSFDFFQTWKAYHIIENFEFAGILKTGRTDDFDDFSKVLMVAYMGLDETKQWFMDKGCVF